MISPVCVTDRGTARTEIVPLLTLYKTEITDKTFNTRVQVTNLIQLSQHDDRIWRPADTVQ